MKTAFFITSIIEVTNFPLTYNPIRSIFGPKERLDHTLKTIDSIVQNCNATIYLIELSKNWQPYEQIFSKYPNLKFISVLEHFPEIHHEVTTHANKSRCETLVTKCFLEKFCKELKEFDFLIKLSGRYCIESGFSLNQIDKNKMVFKRPWSWTWKDEWNYHEVKLPGSDKLSQYCSVIFGWGQDHYDKMLAIYQTMSEKLSMPHMQHYDIETWLYYLTRPYQEYILELDWTVNGLLGPTGEKIRY